jgi:hypothetical protein
MEWLTNLAFIDVERTGDFEIVGEIPSEVVVHQAGLLGSRFRAPVPVVLDTLNEAARAIANADDADPDFRHTAIPYPLARTCNPMKKREKTRSL